MKKIYSLLIALVLLLGNISAQAQNEGMALSLLPNQPYNNLYNPGVRVNQKLVLGLGISNINVGIYNTSIKYNNLYTQQLGVSALDLNKFINSLDDHDNYIGTNFSMDILRAGARFNKLFVDINWRARFNTEIHYSKDFLGFFVNGNGHYMGTDNPADFSIGVDANLYTELSIGAQYDINDKLTVGIRPKLLNGIANASVNDDGTMIYTDPNTYEIIANADINIKMSSIVEKDIHRISEVTDVFDMDSISISELFNFKSNLGFGIDLGASYKISDNIGVALGVYDLGFIKWTNTREKHNHKDNVVINDALLDDINGLTNLNLDVKDLYSDLLADVWDNDSLYAGEDYKTSLKTRVMLQGYYELMPMARFTAVAQMYYANKKMRPALTLAYSGSFLKIINLTANYTFSKYSGNSLGAGINLKLGPVDLYAVTDNFLILTKLNASTVKMVTSYRTTNVRLGLIIAIGEKKK